MRFTARGPIPVVQGRLLGGDYGTDPGVIHEHVYTPQALHDAVHHLSHRLLVGDITRDRQRLVANPSEFTQRFLGCGEVIGGHGIPTLGEYKSDPTPNAPSRPGHHGDSCLCSFFDHGRLCYPFLPAQAQECACRT